ncbi:MAG: hypothetical protein ACOYOP_16345 [Microthrixaceae bacterium]
MTITEETRYQLYKKLEAELGPDDANTLMEHLPPLGWADVATKQDLAQLEQRMHLRFEVMEHRIDASERRLATTLAETMHRQFVQTIASTAALLTVMLTLAVTVNQLLGG